MTMKTQLTTNGGKAIADQNALSAGPRGPLLMQDYQLQEKLAHQNRERIPERTVHAKGSGAYRTLTITHDITKSSKPVVFAQVGNAPPGTRLLARRVQIGKSMRKNTRTQTFYASANR